MRILLLQDEIYLPSMGGGTKANRLLLEALARRGHAVAVISPALTGARIGPTRESEFMAEMTGRSIELREDHPGVLSYRYRGVAVDAMRQASGELVRRCIEQFAPDWILVNDDKRRILLSSAMQYSPQRVALLLQTVVQLPFGPLSVGLDPKHAQLMGNVRTIFVISTFLRQYIQQHGGLESRIVRLPVYGPGPFPQLGRFDRGLVTIINPCHLKGSPIFLALAKTLPAVEFAAVPTWGTDDATLDALRALPNIRIVPPADDIDQILAQTRVLLVPSLWPETFGYVVPEAMLRGIPVLASDVGGLPEAKLGVDYLLPVSAAQRRNGTYVAPPQDIAPWERALGELLSDSRTYDRVSRLSRDAAMTYVSTIDDSEITDALTRLG